MNPRIQAIREQIAAGTYDTPAKLDVALDRMIDAEVERDQAAWDQANVGDRWE